MVETLHLRLQYDGVEEYFLASVVELVDKVSRGKERVSVVLDVFDLPTLIDAKLIYEACKIITESMTGLENIVTLTVKCRQGLQEYLARSALFLLSTPFPVSVLASPQETSCEPQYFR